MQITISTQNIAGEVIQTANGRDIHRELCVKKDYSNWVKAQIERADLVENTDYVKVAQKGELSATGQTSIEYHFTVESGKHVAISYSIDFRPLLLASPAMDDIQDEMLNWSY